jgi:hypothetical protein
MEVPMATAQLIDQAKQEAFVNKVLGDTSATMTTILASIGDRLGLFKDLATIRLVLPYIREDRTCLANTAPRRRGLAESRMA